MLYVGAAEGSALPKVPCQLCQHPACLLDTCSALLLVAPTKEKAQPHHPAWAETLGPPTSGWPPAALQEGSWAGLGWGRGH